MEKTPTKIAAVLNQPTWFMCRRRVYDIRYAIRTIDAMGGGNTEPMILLWGEENECDERPSYREETDAGQ